MEFIGQNTIIMLTVHEPIKRVILEVTEIALNRVGMNISINRMRKNVLISMAELADICTIEMKVR